MYNIFSNLNAKLLLSKCQNSGKNYFYLFLCKLKSKNVVCGLILACQTNHSN